MSDSAAREETQEVNEENTAEVTVLRPSDLQPGDVLLVRAPQPQTPQHLQALVAYLQELSTVTGCRVFYAPSLVEVQVLPGADLPEDAQPLASLGPGDGLTH